MHNENYYEFMGISRDATSEEIKRAYRKLALKYHPDTGSEPDESKIKRLNFIYAILSDPSQRSSYDYGTANENESARQHYKETHQKRSHSTSKDKQDEKPEDYSKGIFVKGIEALDSVNTTSYIELGDYLYYKIKVNKRAFIFTYQGYEYYRTKVVKIYSRRHNNFRRQPLFVVNFENVDHIIFEDEFKKYWLSEKGFDTSEKRKAVTSFAIGMTIIIFVAYKLLNMS